MSALDELRRAPLTAGLSDDQRSALLAAGREVEAAADTQLFIEGRTADEFWILLSGRIELTRRIGEHTSVVGTMHELGQWAGGLSAWGGEAAVYRASGRTVAPTRCLAVPSDRLGSLVEEWSPFARHLIVGIFQTVRSIDAAARERESLVALGHLAAGLAHEINNPAAASMRAVDGLRNALEFLLAALVALAEQDVRAEQFLRLDALRRELQGREAAHEGAIERADREESIGTWLEDHDVGVSWLVAPALAARSVDLAWLEELEAAVEPDALAPAVQWITSALGSTSLLEELTDATARITHLVQDVKTYSALDRAELDAVDVRAGIDSTITMLGPVLAGMEIVRRYDTVPDVEVHAAELNQVWTNLIVNARDATDGEGRLEIAVRVEGDQLVVEISDDGPGIDASVLPHIFEPFFTTKDVGQGTGLGLDIARRIVERHKGQIGFDSRPGATTARVRIPLSR